MYIRKLTAAAFILFFSAAYVFAQDSFFDENSSSEGFSADSEESSEGGFDSGFGDSGFGDFSDVSDTGSMEPELEIGGKLKYQSRYYTDAASSGNIEDVEVESFPEVNLLLEYKKENSEFKADLIFSRDRMFSDYEDLINEAYLTIYYDSFSVETGFMKVVWGKGDELKAVDILNQIDYSDFYNKDLLERKTAAPMFKLNKDIGLNGLLELVYIPYKDYPKFDDPVNGRWAPSDLQTLTSIPNIKTNYKDTETLDSSQAALRYTNSAGGFDYGLIYSYGFMPMPTTKLNYTGAVPETADIQLERANIFGIEAAKVVFGLNSRAEFAYYMSRDIKGNDPDVQNNEIVWVFGFDKDLPVSSMNLLIETQGSYTLNNSEIKSMSASNPEYDVDYNSDGTYSQNIIIAKLKDSLNHDRIRPEVSFTFHVEDQDFMLRPETEFILKDDISFDILYTYFCGDKDTPFGVYEDNSFLQAKLVYSF